LGLEKKKGSGGVQRTKKKERNCKQGKRKKKMSSLEGKEEAVQIKGPSKKKTVCKGRGEKRKVRKVSKKINIDASVKRVPFAHGKEWFKAWGKENCRGGPEESPHQKRGSRLSLPCTPCSQEKKRHLPIKEK